jgi:Tol biopolymer transport system component
MDETSHIFTVSAEEGLPERLDYGTEEARCPVWSPDGTKVVFEARSAIGGKHDFLIARTTGPRHELSRPLDLQKELRAQNLPVISSNIDCPQDWIEDRLLFVTHQRDTSFLFQRSLGTSGRLGRVQAVPSAIRHPA